MRKGTMKKTENRWKEEDGRVAATLLDIWNSLRECAKKFGATPDLLGWLLTPEGKESVALAVQTVVEAWKTAITPSTPKKAGKSEPIRIKANLDADPSLPFDGAVFEGKEGAKHVRQGKVELEYRPDEDELYVNGRKLVPFVSELQKGGKTVQGYTLQAEVDANNPTNATLADVLYEHQEFIPKKFRDDRVWFFWGTVFSVSVGLLYVRCLVWDDVQWRRDCSWQGDVWVELLPSASLASEPSKLETKAS